MSAIRDDSKMSVDNFPMEINIRPVKVYLSGTIKTNCNLIMHTKSRQWIPGHSLSWKQKNGIQNISWHGEILSYFEKKSNMLELIWRTRNPSHWRPTARTFAYRWRQGAEGGGQRSESSSWYSSEGERAGAQGVGRGFSSLNMFEQVWGQVERGGLQIWTRSYIFH